LAGNDKVHLCRDIVNRLVYHQPRLDRLIDIRVNQGALYGSSSRMDIGPLDHIFVYSDTAFDHFHSGRHCSKYIFRLNMPKLTRREIIKLMGALAANTLLADAHPLADALNAKDSESPNIIVLVIDTLSARHMSLYSYERQTTPNFERFAARASVYHSHYSGGNFTTPGTATILTGQYPWGHRAINLGAPVRRAAAEANLFRLLGEERRSLGFTQNILAEVFLQQFRANLHEHLPLTSYSSVMKALDISKFFPSDPLVAHYAFDDFLINSDVTSNPVPGSAYFGYLDMFYGQFHETPDDSSQEYPRGMPSTGKYFYDNHKVYTGVFDAIQELEKQSEPYFAYMHLLSPHAKYCPRREFVGIFPEIKIPFKERHKLGNHVRQSLLNEYRMQYDEYIANVDAEFGSLLDQLEASGILDHSYFVVTSDHGELFERGENGHNTFLLYDSVIHIPLLISAPQQTDRHDVYSRTSNIDLAPTLLNIAGKDIPSSLQGRFLPGLGGKEDGTRSIFAVEAKTNSAFGPLKRATITLMKENYKIIYYGDYPRYMNVFELYDLEEDIDEKQDLFAQGPSIASLLKEELLDTLSTVNKPFERPKPS
jgi:arylsulfatase A-like enzyme